MNLLFDQIRERMPDLASPFLRRADGGVISYGDLLDRSSGFAHALVALGVKPGDRVAMQIDKCPDALVLYLACVRAGAVLLPLNTAYTISELDYFLSDATPALVVCSPENEAAIKTIAGTARLATLGPDGGNFLNFVPRGGAAFKPVPRAAADLAAILYTSGTTGRSKGAMLTHENLASNARVLTELWRFTAQDVLIHALPVFHIHGLFVATNVTLFAGASMLFFERFDAGEIIRAMPQATALMGVPTFYTRLLDRPDLSAEAARSIRVFISGSAPLLPETFHAFRARTGHAILERYGMTETGMLTSNPYDGERIAETVGLPLEGVGLRITDPHTGRPLPRGQVGMIEVQGPNVFPGYWNMPEKTASEFRDGYFITGDLGSMDDKGYVRIVGRSKDLVISGGYNVYPKEVEGEIDRIAGVTESAVIGLPHPDFGEGVTAIVVRSRDIELSETALIEQLQSRLARFKQPKRVIFVDELPRNTMGKVQKAVLREQYRELYTVNEPAQTLNHERC